MSTKNTELTERLADIHTKLAVVKELTEIIPALDKNASQEDMMVAHVLQKVLKIKTAELDNEINSVGQDVNTEVNRLKSEVEKYKNAEHQ